VAEGDGEGQTTGAHSATPDVFISYASHDAATATTVVEALERNGVACWIAPRDVTPGAFYADEIVHAIDASKAIVLVLSQSATDSQHVLREVEHAVSKRHPVVSFRVDQAPLPAGLGYFLNTSQWLDASGGDIVRSMPKLIAAVRVAIQAPVVTPGPAPTPRGPAPSPSARPAKHTAIIVASLIGLVIAGFEVDRLWVSSRRAASSSLPTTAVPAPAPAPALPTIPEKSVAVLPFVDMSEKKDQEYFADGTAEEILDLLAKVPGLHVPARTSSFYFKGKSEDIPTIARRLMVAHVLEGSVRKAGDRMRITVQLIRADNGYHLWSETYDRTLDDIFKVQDEIALAVVTALKASLLQQDLDRSTITTQPEVYTLYLQGVSSWNRGTTADFHKAVEYLKRALALDPNYAPAWGILGQVLMDDFFYSGSLTEMRKISAQVHEAAQKAIALDPKSSNGHLALARAFHWFDWRWDAAEAEYKSAMDLDPQNAEAYGMASYLSVFLGRCDEAVRLATNAAKIDPLNSFTYLYLGDAQECRGNLAEAEAAYRKSLELNPAADEIRGILGMLLLRKGDATAALTQIEQEPMESFRRVLRPLALDALGRRAEADREITALEQTPNDHVYGLAAIYASRNDANRAFVLLDLAYQQHSSGVLFLRVDDRFRNLVRDPRYKALLHKMNLPD